MAIHLKDLPLDKQIEIVRSLSAEDQIDLARERIGEVLSLIGARTSSKKTKEWLRNNPRAEETCQTIQMQMLCIALVHGKLEAAKWLRKRVKNPDLEMPEGRAKELYEDYLRTKRRQEE